MVNFISNAFLTIIQFLLRVFRKALCCLRRRRRFSGEPVALTNIGIVPNVEKEKDLQNWNSWEDSTDNMLTSVTTNKPLMEMLQQKTNSLPVQQQIEMYRQQRIAMSQNQNKEEPKVDYFQDMVPKIVKQKKFLRPKENEECVNVNHYSLALDPSFNSSELGVWEDSQSWEDQTEKASWDANIMLREKKKIDREERLAKQLKEKLEKKSKGQTGWSQAQNVRNDICFPDSKVEFDFH